MVTQAELIAKVSSVFSPAAPINRRDLFAGRIPELERVFEAANTRGQHAVIFGERGVGKTSLATIVQDILSSQTQHGDNYFVVKINCSQDDDFTSAWNKAFSEIELSADTGKTAMGLGAAKAVREDITAAELLPEQVKPGNVLKLARQLGKTVIIFDEFDRVDDDQGLFADTIKTLSDSSADCTIILVGVARDIDTLVKEHASVDRALVQIMMARMTPTELHEILNKAMNALQMNMSADARNLIVLLSQGLPHYTHVLGKASSIECIKHDQKEIALNDVLSGITTAIQNTQQSIRNSYQEATATSRKDTLFKAVLLACALADVDELGFFTASSVRDPLSKIMGRRYEIPNFAQHLDKFSSADRGNVLEKTGTQRRFRFRFSNPLLQPFVIMRG